MDDGNESCRQMQHSKESFVCRRLEGSETICPTKSAKRNLDIGMPISGTIRVKVSKVSFCFFFHSAKWVGLRRNDLNLWVVDFKILGIAKMLEHFF